MEARSRDSADPIDRSGTAVIAQVVIAALLGVLVLPNLFGFVPVAGLAAPALARPEPLIWLGLGLVVTVWLVVLAPRLTGVLANALASASWVPHDEDGEGRSRANPRVLAATLVAAGYIGLVEAIVRRPLVAATGGFATSWDVDAVVAGLALAVLLVILLRLYAAARPFIESGASRALDVVATTSSSEAITRFSDLVETAATIAATPSTPTNRAASAEPTIATVRPTAGDAATIASFNRDDTVGAGSPDAEATQIAPDSSTRTRMT